MNETKNKKRLLYILEYHPKNQITESADQIFSTAHLSY